MADKPEEQRDQSDSKLTTKPVSRRDFLKIAGIAGATIGMGAGLGGVLAACGGDEETTTTAAGETTTTAAAETTTTPPVRPLPPPRPAARWAARSRSAGSP